MITPSDDKQEASHADLQRAVEVLKKEEATADRGDMPVDSSLGQSETEGAKTDAHILKDDDREQGGKIAPL